MSANLVIESVVAEARRAELLARAERARRAAVAAAPRPGLARAVRRALAGPR
jgi:hypothetical protein